jgi:myo-inositol-1(or 4)-monophosphatase
MPLDLTYVQTVAENIARDAGKVLMNFFEQPHQEQSKSNFADIVTEGDKASEAVIVKALTEAFPDHHIVGEEGGGMGAPAETATYFWYVDPLDGTTNFANNIPLFAVSMALADRERRPLVGVVYDPNADEMFSAVTGKGATLNGKPLRVSDAPNLSRAVLATGFPYDVTISDNNLREWAAFSLVTRSMRCYGSAALHLCWTAAGRFDGYWEQYINLWDYLAGALCVLEAGGTVTDYEGKEAYYKDKKVIASNGRIHSEMLGVIQNCRQTT